MVTASMDGTMPSAERRHQAREPMTTEHQMTSRKTEGATERCLHGVVRCVEVSNQLRENLMVMKRLIGDKWEASSKEYRVILLAVMAASGDANPLACALPMAKEMSERGHSPLMLLAVATEMSEASNDGAMPRAVNNPKI